MFRKPRTPPDPGLQQIVDWERWLVDGNLQRMRDNGLDEDAINRERPALESMAAAAHMRAAYLSNRARGTQQP